MEGDSSSADGGATALAVATSLSQHLKPPMPWPQACPSVSSPPSSPPRAPRRHGGSPSHPPLPPAPVTLGLGKARMEHFAPTVVPAAAEDVPGAAGAAPPAQERCRSTAAARPIQEMWGL